MAPVFEEIEVHDTWLGELVLRRRTPAAARGRLVYEVLLDGMFLMSSHVNASEIALAELGLAMAPDGPLEVVVGGLGLGCTAAAALDHAGVSSVLVVECLRQVIDWHTRGLVPLGERLTGDPRCEFVHGDFFALAGPGAGFDSAQPGRRFHAILMDIDHSPRALLHGSHQEFYEAESMAAVAAHLLPGGVFALWSADPPEPEFIQVLDRVFAEHRVHEIEFHNDMLSLDELNTVYVARVAAG